VVPDAVGLMLVVSIPALALTMIATRRAFRLASVAAFLGFMVAASVAFRMTGESETSLVRQGVTLAGGALVLLAIAAFGRVSVVSWLLAALFSVALGNISFALHAPTGIERVGGVLGAVVAASLMAGGAILSVRASSGRPAFTSSFEEKRSEA
jgi:peptidoglycan/LPS O-acetylase OafA/YrhL